MAIIVVCVAITLALNFAPRLVPISIAAPNPGHLWNGQVWGLVTSAFVHQKFWHLAFNMWWTRDLGRLLEPKLGVARFVALVVVSAFVSSGAELLIGHSGIGFSGVVYALFGYALARRAVDPECAAFITPRTIRWMIGWLFLCIALTVLDIWNVGNAAHIGGLLVGWSLGAFFVEPRARIAAGAMAGLLIALSIMSIVYMPWSSAWRSRESLFELETMIDKANAGDPDAAATVGSLYAHEPKYRQEGLAWLRQSAEAGNTRGMNSLAWMRATCKDADLRSADDAIHWATIASSRDPNASYTDTLAAAYAEAGRWKEAVETEELAITRLKPYETDLAGQLDAHLTLLRKNEPIRE